MKLADVMDKVEVGMKMVVRSEYNPEYEVFGGKVVEKKGVYHGGGCGRLTAVVQ